MMIAVYRAVYTLFFCPFVGCAPDDCFPLISDCNIF
jgi:hypothetical protein